jgi:hypothetical protein
MARKARRAKTKTKAARPKDLSLKRKPAAKVKGGDEVLVAFTHGDVRSPVIVGNLWNSTDRPPTTTKK